jgi:hypothetical protein
LEQSTYGVKMNFDVNYFSEGELCERLAHIKLKGGNTQPYLNSYLSIETLDPSILAPTQRYVLSKELKKLEQIRWDIEREYGYDILRLAGYLQVTYPPCSVGLSDGTTRVYANPEVIDILPPIVEEYINPRGMIDLIICDGQHRCFLAYMMGLPLNVVYVRGINKGYPYYAFPLPNGWKDVEIRDDIPSGYIKKFHVAKEHKRLYRWFNDEFSNIGDSRPYSSGEK